MEGPNWFERIMQNTYDKGPSGAFCVSQAFLILNGSCEANERESFVRTNMFDTNVLLLCPSSNSLMANKEAPTTQEANFPCISVRVWWKHIGTAKFVRWEREKKFFIPLMTRRPFFISSQTNLLIRNSIYMQGIRIDVRSARMKRGLIVCVGVFRVCNVTDRACFLEADEQKIMEIKSW